MDETEVTIMGKVFKKDGLGNIIIPATVLEEREKSFDAKLQETSNELGELRKFKDEAESRKAVSDPEVIEAYDFYSNPKSAFTKIKADVTKEMESKLEEAKNTLRKEYADNITVREFWADFFTENKELKQHKQLVHTVAQEKLEQIKNLTNNDEIAKIIREGTYVKIAQLRQSAAEKEVPEVVESGGSSFLGDIAKKIPSDGKVLSFGDSIAARRKAKLGG